MQYRERPRCRKVIEKLLEQYPCKITNLQETLRKNSEHLSPGLKIQLKKMIQESKEK